MSEITPPKGILETILYTSALDAAETFYSDILGLPLASKMDGRQIFYRCGDQMLLIFNPKTTSQPAPNAKIPVPPHGAEGPGHICFRASANEIEKWRHRLNEYGVEIEMDFEWPGGGRSIYFRDPAGNCLEFAEPRIWELS
ncbi:MAG: VOC family protein [Hyphomicrobiaceae bacterium]